LEVEFARQKYYFCRVIEQEKIHKTRIELAKNGLPAAMPNLSVGVIVLKIQLLRFYICIWRETMLPKIHDTICKR
jgi:hypothetical protein